MLLLIDNYDSFTYNLAQYLGELGQDVRVERNDSISVDGVGEIGPACIVISPGPCTPNEAGISMDVVSRYAGQIPILGVCLGHQAIAQVFGGRIIRAETVMHGKISKVFHDDSGLFVGLPNPIETTRYHSLIVERETLPEDLVITAKTWDDEIMGVRHQGFAQGRAPLEGVQFHPESIKTPEGKDMLRNFLTMAGQD